MRWNDRIGRRIKLSDLHILLAVSQSGSMARAAHSLAVSHPVISRSIAQLEHALGARLLERGRHGVELTEYGRAMINRSCAAFDELRQGVKEIEFLSDPAAGEVRIGTTPPLAASFVSAVIERLSRRYPRITFSVLTGGGALQRRRLSERVIDLLVFRRTSYFFDDQLHFERLFESPYVVAVGVKNPWLKRRRVELSDLMDEKWLLPQPDDTYASFVEQTFRAVGLKRPDAAVTASNPELCANLLRTNRFVAIIPQFWLQFPNRHQFIKALPVEWPIPAAPIGIIGLKNREPNPVVRRFITYAHEVARPLNKTSAKRS